MLLCIEKWPIIVQEVRRVLRASSDLPLFFTVFHCFSLFCIIFHCDLLCFTLFLHLSSLFFIDRARYADQSGVGVIFAFKMI